MANNLNGIDRIKQNINKAIKESLQKVANEIYNDWREKVENEIYSYPTANYEKTWELYNSIKVSQVEQNGDKFSVSIYIEDEIHGYTEYWTEENSSYPDIYNKFRFGFHKGEVIDPSDEIREEYIDMGRWIIDLKSMLNKNGIAVK